jgi:hypothetical protein
MAYVKRIICLANSKKTGGSCIAGRELLPDNTVGGWIRPVSASPTAELLWQHARYANNYLPKLLDIIDVPLLGPLPHLHQTENHLIDPSTRWVKTGEFPWSGLPPLCEYPVSLWINSDRTSTGTFNCISNHEATSLNSSLLLIHKNEITLEKFDKSWGGRSRQSYAATFSHNNVVYSFDLTDPVAMNALKSGGGARLNLLNAYLCISLTEPWPMDNNRCYKLVAAVICNPPL